ADRLGLKDNSAGILLQQAIAETIYEDKQAAVADARQVLKMTNAPNIQMNAAIILALGGEDKEALKIDQDVASRRPYDTLVQFVNLPLVRAAVNLKRGDDAKVIDELDGAMVYARANTGVYYLRGLAYLKLGRANEAVQAFQKILDLRPVST